MVRAQRSGIHLTQKEAAVIKGMIDRGDRQHDIAAYFGVNGGRIGEISTGEKFDDVEPQLKDLPPAGPYLSGKASHEARAALGTIEQQLSTLLKDVRGAINSIDKGRRLGDED